MITPAYVDPVFQDASEMTRRHLCKTHEMLANALTKVENKHAYLHFAKVFYHIRE